MNSEAASRKRGRPKVLPPKLPALGELGTRATQEAFYSALLDPQQFAQEFPWLFSPRPRLGILAQLGRMALAGYCEEDVRACMRDLCARKPSSKAAVAWLRDLRFRAKGQQARRSPALSPEEVTTYFCKAYNAMIDLHPKTTWDDLRDGLRVFIELVQANQPRAEEDPA